MVFDWESSGTADDLDHGHSHDADHTPADHQPKSDKSSKVGKVMWTETAVMAKSAKSDKKSKDSKDSKSKISYKGAKGGYVSRPSSYYSSSVDDHDHDHPHESEDSFLSGAVSSGNMAYGDVFSSSVEVHRNDDFFPEGPSTIEVGMDQVQARSYVSEGITGRKCIIFILRIQKKFPLICTHIIFL